MANQPFHLNWAWISLDTDTLKVNETDSILNVTLRRRGYLGETAFVSEFLVSASLWSQNRRLGHQQLLF